MLCPARRHQPDAARPRPALPNRGIEPLRSANSGGGAFVADGADPLLGFGLDQLLHHHPDRRAAQIHASPGGLAHLRGGWEARRSSGALNPFGGTTPARCRAVGGSTTQLAAEAVVRAARALKRWAAIDVEKQTECHGDQRFAARHSAGPCSPWVEGVADPVVGLQDRTEQAPLAHRDDVFGGRAPWIARLGRRPPPHRWEPDPCTRTSRRTRGTTT
jgi:hypothetical protein